MSCYLRFIQFVCSFGCVFGLCFYMWLDLVGCVVDVVFWGGWLLFVI